MTLAQGVLDMAARKTTQPKFTEAMLQGDDTFAELGITEAGAKVPAGWKRSKATNENPAQSAQRLFSRSSLRTAAREALRRIALSR